MNMHAYPHTHTHTHTVPTYKALHNYAPQNDDDLELVRGEWVTLIETPYGGGWWKGSVEGRVEGWFPKTYVEYVDIEAEKKKVQEGELALSLSHTHTTHTHTHTQSIRFKYMYISLPVHVSFTHREL